MMNEYVAQNLIKLRVENNYTQESVAEKAGISLLAYRNIESQKSEPLVSTLEKISKNVYNIVVEELFKKYTSQIVKVRFRAIANKNIRKREDIIYEVSSWLEKYNSLVKKIGAEEEVA